jgi:hypothetical protein
MHVRRSNDGILSLGHDRARGSAVATDLLNSGPFVVAVHNNADTLEILAWHRLNKLNIDGNLGLPLCEDLPRAQKASMRTALCLKQGE